MSKILVVDDESGMRQVISKVLAPLGHDITGTDEGARAVQMAKEQSPDIVLLDIRLADMDSSDIIIRIKAVKPDVPIIILSGFGDTEAAVELVKLGAFDYISKPFKVNEFVNLVNKALSKTGAKTSSARPPAVQGTEHKKSVVKQAPEAAAAISAVKQSKKSVGLIITIAALVLLAGAGVYSWLTYFSLPGDAEFKAPYSDASGICFENKNMWVTDWAEETIYEHDPGNSLKVINTFKTQVSEPTGITYDGKNLWTSSTLEQKIYKHRLDPALSVEDSFKSPGPSPAGLCFDGKNLWSVDYQQGKLYKHNAANPAEIDAAYDLPAQNPCGIFSRGGYFYVADAKTNRIYKLAADTLFLAGVYAMPGFEDQKRHVASIAYDGKSMWACAGGVDKLFRFKLASLKSVQF